MRFFMTVMVTHVHKLSTALQNVSFTGAFKMNLIQKLTQLFLWYNCFCMDKIQERLNISTLMTAYKGMKQFPNIKLIKICFHCMHLFSTRKPLSLILNT